MTTAPRRASPRVWERDCDQAPDHPDAHLRSHFRSQRPNCPDCGGVILLANHARFHAKGRIDHVWSCDDCGSEFMTSISLTLAV